ncbi:uncharacterized protein [Procambarus clarkii]|uniref:uncharacterized protein n=1 Tax=Procambarus clarkii TaxID=6728 RepID=UPI0037430AD7
MQAIRVVLVAVVGVTVCRAATMLDADVDQDVVDIGPRDDLAATSSAATGRTFSEWGQSIMEWMGFGDDESDEYSDYEYSYYYPPSASSQIGYGLPSVGYQGATGAQQSSYSSYAPVQVAHPQFSPARDDTYEDDDGWSMTDIMYNMALTAVPVGLLLSALPTGLFTIAVRRSFDNSNLLDETMDPSELPLLHALVESDFMALVSRDCQEKLFCEISRIGEREGASFMQKAFYYVATLTPDAVARKVGLARLFRTSRHGHCDMIQCSATSGQRPPPMVTHKPVDTNRIFEEVSTSEKDAVEVARE